MSRPIKKQSHSGATSTGAGTAFQAKGHADLGLFVSAPDIDTANDTLNVRIEVSQDGTEWAPISDDTGSTVGTVSATEFDSGNAYTYVSRVPAPYIRANVTGYNDFANGDLSVDTYVIATGWTSSGQEYET